MSQRGNAMTKNYNSKGPVKGLEAVLSQKNLANHNQQLSLNPITQRDINLIAPLSEARSSKKRGGASTDMIPK